MIESSEHTLRETVAKFLVGGQAYMPFAHAVADFPPDLINTFPPNVEYSFWHLLEHLRISQSDVLDFCRNPKYKEITWPDDYWPKKDAKATLPVWKKSITDFEKDLKMMETLVFDPSVDLNAKIPHGDGQTYLREAILVAEHNAYHIGEFAILRQVMKAWGKKK